MRKKLIALLVAFTIVLGMLPMALAEDKGVTVELWHYFSDDSEVVLKDLVDRFNTENDQGITVVPTFVARADLSKQYMMGAISGELPDIGMVDNPDHASFTTMGVFQDITDLVEAWGEKDQFFEGSLNTCVLDGKIYGLPDNSNCLAFMYNKDMFEAAGIEKVPETWDELTETAAKLTTDEVYGLVVSMPTSEEATFQFLPWLLSTGATLDDLDTPEAIKAVTYLNGMIEKGYMSKDIINWNQGESNAQFLAGKAAMQIVGPWRIKPNEESNPEMNYAVSLIPHDVQSATVLGGENFGICAGAEREAAWTFLSWYMSADIRAEYCDRAGKFPARRDAVAMREIWTENPVYSMYANALEYAYPRGPHARWPEISSAIYTALHETFTGLKTPEQAMKDADEIISKINEK